MKKSTKKSLTNSLRIKRSGFTLAEVLLTLGIIGVVAAMTIPTLIVNNQKQEYVTGLKKAYSELYQALNQIMIDRNCVGNMPCTGLFDSGTTITSLGDELSSYFKVARNCKTTSTDCMSNAVSDSYDGSSARYDWSSAMHGYNFITADGMSFAILNYADIGAPSCTLFNTCGDVAIDVNGPQKGPNNFGRDIYYLYIMNTPKIIDLPNWRNSTTGAIESCDASVDVGGWSCISRIVQEGWQMNY